MNEYLLALLLFGSALCLLVSGIPIWAGLAGISVLFILIFSPGLRLDLRRPVRHPGPGELILKLPLGKWGVIFLINILLLILGCFIPPAAVILMVAPLLLPSIQGLGFDPVWFAVIMTVNLEIGLVTPPVGLNLCVVKSIAPDIPMAQVLLGAAPFVLIDCRVIVLLCIWPELALWLPNKMIG